MEMAKCSGIPFTIEKNSASGEIWIMAAYFVCQQFSSKLHAK